MNFLWWFKDRRDKKVRLGKLDWQITMANASIDRLSHHIERLGSEYSELVVRNNYLDNQTIEMENAIYIKVAKEINRRFL